jgi:WD40 repeat protein
VALIEGLLAKEPAERPSSAGAVAEALAGIGREILDPPSTLPRQPVPPTAPADAVRPGEGRRLRRLPVSIALAGLAGLLALGIWASRNPIPGAGRDRKTPVKDTTRREVPTDRARILAPGAELSSYDPAFPGLVSTPARLTGVARWQLTTRLPIGPHAVAWGPGGRSIACAGEDRLVRVYQTAGLVLRWLAPGHEATVNALAWSADGHRLVSAGDDGTIRLWDAESGTPGPVLRGHDGAVRGVALSPDGRHLASVGQDGTVRLWDPDGGAAGPVLEGHNGSGNGVAFSPDARQLASVGNDGTVRTWDAVAGTPGRVLREHDGTVHSVAFSPDGHRLASGGRDGTILLWDADAGTVERRLGGTSSRSSGRSVAFSPDGRRLAASVDGTTRALIWDANTGAPNPTPSDTSGGTTLAVAFDPAGRWLVTAGPGQGVQLWDASIARPEPIPDGRVGSLNAVAYGPGGRIAACLGRLGVAVWDVAAAASPRILRGGADRWSLVTVAFHPDGRRLAAGGYEGSVRLWDGDTGGDLHVLRGHDGRINSVAFSADGRLASGGADGTVRLWDADAGTRGPILRGHDAAVRMVAFTPDGRRLVSVDEAGIGRIWEARTGDPGPVARMVGAKTPVQVLDLGPDGRTLAANGGTRVRFWDSETGAPGREFPDADTVFSIRFHPDGRRLAVGNDRGQIRLWDIGAPGSTPRVEARHTGRIDGMSYAPDGRELASCDRDGTLRLWDADTGAPRLVIQTFLNGASVAVTPAGDATPGDSKLEAELIYLVQQSDAGPIERLSHAEFRDRHSGGWPKTTDDRGPRGVLPAGRR